MILSATDLRIGRRFILRAEAVGWGEWMKGEIEKGDA